MKSSEPNIETKTTNLQPKVEETTSFFQKEQGAPFFSSGPQQEQGNKPFFSPATVQPKLSIGKPGDQYEQEADAVADKVVSQLPHTPAATSIQRRCASCEAEEQLQKLESGEHEHALPKATIQRKPIFDSKDEASAENTIQRKCAACEQEEGKIQAKAVGGEQKASSALQSQLKSTKGSGRSLPKATRSSMESAIGADFSKVRIHTDRSAIQMNKELGAQAFTHGQDIYFNAGKYDTSSSGGQHLLAHELTHVVQQGGRDTKISRQATNSTTAISQLSDAALEKKILTIKQFLHNNKSASSYGQLQSYRQQLLDEVKSRPSLDMALLADAAPLPQSVLKPQLLASYELSELIRESELIEGWLQKYGSRTSEGKQLEKTLKVISLLIVQSKTPPGLWGQFDDSKTLFLSITYPGTSIDDLAIYIYGNSKKASAILNENPQIGRSLAPGEVVVLPQAANTVVTQIAEAHFQEALSTGSLIRKSDQQSKQDKTLTPYFYEFTAVGKTYNLTQEQFEYFLKGVFGAFIGKIAIYEKAIGEYKSVSKRIKEKPRSPYENFGVFQLDIVELSPVIVSLKKEILKGEVTRSFLSLVLMFFESSLEGFYRDTKNWLSYVKNNFSDTPLQELEILRNLVIGLLFDSHFEMAKGLSGAKQITVEQGSAEQLGFNFEEPESLQQSLAVSLMSDGGLQKEAGAIRTWLLQNPEPSDKGDFMKESLWQIEEEAFRRGVDGKRAGSGPEPASLNLIEGFAQFNITALHKEARLIDLWLLNNPDKNSFFLQENRETLRKLIRFSYAPPVLWGSFSKKTGIGYVSVRYPGFTLTDVALYLYGNTALETELSVKNGGIDGFINPGYLVFVPSYPLTVIASEDQRSAKKDGTTLKYPTYEEEETPFEVNNVELGGNQFELTSGQLEAMKKGRTGFLQKKSKNINSAFNNLHDFIRDHGQNTNFLVRGISDTLGGTSHSSTAMTAVILEAEANMHRVNASLLLTKNEVSVEDLEMAEDELRKAREITNKAFGLWHTYKVDTIKGAGRAVVVMELTKEALIMYISGGLAGAAGKAAKFGKLKSLIAGATSGAALHAGVSASQQYATTGTVQGGKLLKDTIRGFISGAVAGMGAMVKPHVEAWLGAKLGLESTRLTSMLGGVTTGLGEGAVENAILNLPLLLQGKDEEYLKNIGWGAAVSGFFGGAFGAISPRPVKTSSSTALAKIPDTSSALAKVPPPESTAITRIPERETALAKIPSQGIDVGNGVTVLPKGYGDIPGTPLQAMPPRTNANGDVSAMVHHRITGESFEIRYNPVTQTGHIINVKTGEIAQIRNGQLQSSLSSPSQTVVSQLPLGHLPPLALPPAPYVRGWLPPPRDGGDFDYPSAEAARNTFRSVHQALENAGFTKTPEGGIKPDTSKYSSVEVRENGDVLGTYYEVKKYIKETGLSGQRRSGESTIEVHHLLEDRLLKQFGIKRSQGYSVALEYTDHALFSAELPRHLPKKTYYDIDDVFQAHVDMYRALGHPEWIPEIRVFLRNNRGRIRQRYLSGRVPGANHADFGARRERVFNFLDNL